MKIYREKNFWHAEIVRFSDGDTVLLDIDLGFEVRIRKAVRLLGVEAYELDGPQAEQAKLDTMRANTTFAGSPCKVMPGGGGFDKYGRVRAHVTVNDGDLGELLVQMGICWPV